MSDQTLTDNELRNARDLAVRIEQWADQRGASLHQWGYALPYWAREGSAALARVKYLLSPRFTDFTVNDADGIKMLHFARKS